MATPYPPNPEVVNADHVGGGAHNVVVQMMRCGADGGWQAAVPTQVSMENAVEVVVVGKALDLAILNYDH